MRSLPLVVSAAASPFAVVASLCALALGQTCVVGQPTSLGVVVPQVGICPGGAGSLAGSSCFVVEVNCTGLMPLQVQLRVIPPASGVTERGTVVFGSGASGTGFYPNGDQLFPMLTSMGFRVVDRAWLGAQGWTTAEAGLRRESCRYATLLHWIRNNVHQQGAFCASGNSGGSAEVGYALTTWQAGSILDLAVPTSGPAVARLDYACASPTPAEWIGLCQAIVPTGFLTCVPGCTLGANGVCNQCAGTPTLQDLREDSVEHPQAQLHYPQTRVHFLYGTGDCGQSVPIGMNWSQKVTSEKVIEFVDNTGHGMSASVEGREAIRRAIDNGTSGPSSSHARVLAYGIGCGSVASPAPRNQAYGTPWLGNTTFLLRVEGAGAATFALLMISAAQAQIPFGFGCDLLIDPAPGQLLLSSALATSAQGFAQHGVPIPNSAQLSGLTLHSQWAVMDIAAPLGFTGSRGLTAVLGSR